MSGLAESLLGNRISSAIVKAGMRRFGVPVLIVLVAAACGQGETSAPTTELVQPAATVQTGSTPDTETGPAPSAPPWVLGERQCETGDVAFVDAQFGFVGKVTSITGEIKPWDVNTENPDRPGQPQLSAWVSFNVEGWYTNDWGSTFSVWMPQHAVEVGQRLAVAGDARHVSIDGFSGQSGEVEFCSDANLEGALSSWDTYFGTAVVAGAGVPEGQPDIAVLENIAAAKEAWLAMNLDSYSYLLSLYDRHQPANRCGANFVRIVVESGEIVEAIELRPQFNQSVGCHIVPSDLPTIPELFDQAGASAGATSFSFSSNISEGVVLEFFASDRSVELQASVTDLSTSTDRAVVGWPDVSVAAASARTRWSNQPFDHEVAITDSEGFRAYFNIVSTVVNGVVVEVRHDDDVIEPATLEEPWTPYTVEGVFDLIDRLENDGNVVAVFDAATGAPTHVWFDPIPNAIDDELAKRIVVTAL